MWDFFERDDTANRYIVRKTNRRLLRLTASGVFDTTR